MRWLYIVIIFGIVVIILLLTYVKIKIRYIFNGGNDLTISIEYISSCFNMEIRPFDKEKTDIQKINKIQKENYELSINTINQFKEILNYAFNKVVVNKFSWETKIGYIDAFYLSIIYGCVWWLKSLIKSILFFNKEIESFNINVIPVYNTNQLDISFNCIIKIRMVYIINIWIRTLKLYKGGEEFGRTSNRRINEYYNE